MLENLEPAPKIAAPNNFRPGVEFDGLEGTATTEGLPEQPNFDDFLRERGYPPEEYKIVGTPRTSQWQTYHGDWLTSYRFSFRKKQNSVDVLKLFADVKRQKIKVNRPKPTERALILAPSDFQIGKTGSRGGTKELIERVFASYDRAEELMKRNKYERIYIIELGDLIESISNTADQQQIATNDLSVTDQVIMLLS